MTGGFVTRPPVIDGGLNAYPWFNSAVSRGSQVEVRLVRAVRFDLELEDWFGPVVPDGDLVLDGPRGKRGVTFRVLLLGKQADPHSVLAHDRPGDPPARRQGVLPAGV